MELEAVSEGPSHRVAALGNVLVCVYWDEPPVQALTARLPWLERTTANGGAMGLFVLVTADAAGRLPGRAFRSESKRQANLFRRSCVLSASVIEGTGVTTVLIRSFLRGLATVAGKGIQIRFFEQTSPAATWVAGEMAPHQGPDEHAIAEAVESLRPEPLPLIG